MNLKRIILCAIILMISISSLSIVSAGLFDLWNESMNNIDNIDSVYDGPFEVLAYNVTVLNSNLAVTDKEIESSDYGYFYEDGSYAEAAYLTYEAEDFYIELDMNNITLSSDSILESIDSSGNIISYNETNLVDDITKVVKSDDGDISISFYDEDDFEVGTYSNYDYDFDVSMKNGIFTLKYSNSSYSDYHTAGATTNSDLTEVDHASIYISGYIDGTNSTKEVELEITSANMPATGTIQ